jgi:uncharacterized membrane protein
MADFKILAALMAALAASACSSAAPELSPQVAAIDQKCADTASTGDSYRYCVQLGLEQAGLAVPGTDEGPTLEALRAK